jgi:REJ domain
MNTILDSMDGYSRSDVMLFRSPYFETPESAVNNSSLSRRSLLDTANNNKYENKNKYNGHVAVTAAKTQGSLTFNASALLVALNASSGEAAFNSVYTQLNDYMDSGSFLSRMIATSTALQPVTRAYITMLVYSVNRRGVSRSPSASPSPSSSPSSIAGPVAVAVAVAGIRVIGVTRSSVDVSVTVLQPAAPLSGDVMGSTLYCIALADGSLPSSIGAVKAANTDGFPSRGLAAAVPLAQSYPLSMNMSITNLNATQTYAIYCYAETAVGAGNDLSAVVRTGISATTPCCRMVSFKNAPSYVYSDVKRYNASSSVLYIFTYELPVAPMRSLQVTPVITLGGLTSSTITAVPPTSTFTSSSQLTGQFYLSASPSPFDISATLSLTFGGLDLAQYGSESTAVKVLSSASLIPAPIMNSCQFSDNAEAAFVYFDSPTDKASIKNATWSCALLFDFTGSSSSACTWLRASTVRISFATAATGASAGSGNYMVAKATVTLVTNKLRAFCTLTATAAAATAAAAAAQCALNPTASGSVIALAPRTPTAPVVIITAPSTLGACTNLSLDASESYGNGGRPYRSVLWTVTAVSYGIPKVSYNTSTIASYLNSFSSVNQVSRPIVIARDLLVTATYTFTLQLTNFLGLSWSTTVNVDVTESVAAPTVAIIGALYQTTLASSPFSVMSETSLSACASAAAVTYTWTVQRGGTDTAIASISPDPSRFTLPSHYLAVDSTYNLTVTAKTSASSSSASVTVYVYHGSVTAIVPGGYERSVPYNEDLILDASSSIDDDVPSISGQSNLAFKVCTIQTYRALSCLALPCLALPCLALPCLALPCLALPCLALPCLALPCLALSCLALPCLALPCLALPCLALSCLALSCLVLPCLAMPCLALSCLVLPCLALSCLALPCLALPCHVMLSPAMSYLT